MNTTAHLPRPRTLLLALATMFVLAANAFADGVFVAPKFVWDKHKDINEPTQKAILVYDAGQEDMILQVKYEGPLEQFGWLIPVPSLPTVKNGSMKCFYELSQYTQQHFPGEAPPPSKGSEDFGMATLSAGAAPEPPVKVVETKTVGAYEIAVLSTRDSSALTQWLQTNQFYFPPDKTDVLDSYVKQQWYFVAVKISLGHSVFTSKSSTASQLASGELNPLQISFASGQCVFPLKISSVNSQPSEVQIYVLSPKPLLEAGMLEQKLPLICSNDLAQAAMRGQWYRNSRLRTRSLPAQNRSSPGPLLSVDEEQIKQISTKPVAMPDELLPFAKVTKADLTESCKWIPRLAHKDWWLTKQKWTFQPEKMRDLEFMPAVDYFSEHLDSKYGYFAAESLAGFSSDAVPALLTALQNPNPAVRVKAATILNPGNGPIRDPKLTAASIGLLKDSQPEVRAVAARMLGDDWNPRYVAPLVEALNDDNVEVRWQAEYGLQHHPADITNYFPRFQAMLNDQNLGTRAVAFELLYHLHIPISQDDLLAVFQAPSLGVVWEAYRQFTQVAGRDVSDAEDLPLLQNQDPNIRGGLGLVILYQNADKQAVELALPLLKDPEIPVRIRAAATLRALTGQPFTDEQAAEWTNWWAANKTSFVVQLHPEELRPPAYRRFPGNAAGE